MALTSLTESLFGQVKINGNLKALGNSSVLLQYYEGNISKSVNLKVTDGKFSWEAPVTEAQKITMIFPGRAIYLFIEPGNINITGSRDSLEQLKITGSKINDEALAYAKTMKVFEEEQKPLLLQYGKLAGEEKTALEEKLADIVSRKNTAANDYIAAHSQSAFSLNLVTEYSRLGNYEDVLRMYGLLSKKMKSTAEGQRIAERLVILKRSAAGEKIMDFTKKDDKGNPVSIAAFKGKYVYIDFWASWCAPCRREIPNLIKTYNTFKDHNFTVVSVSLDDPTDKDRWLAALTSLKMPWTQLADLKGWDDEIRLYYGFNAVPSTLLLDPNGTIIAKDLRGVALDKKLKELFL